MNRKGALLILGLVALLVALVAGGAALAQTSASYNLEWHVIGGGGQPIGSAHYLVHSTAGQDAASPPLSLSASYAVSGGYWYGDISSAFQGLYLPVVLRSYP
jgi:hypothetical protein